MKRIILNSGHSLNKFRSCHSTCARCISKSPLLAEININQYLNQAFRTLHNEGGIYLIPHFFHFYALVI